MIFFSIKIKIKRESLVVVILWNYFQVEIFCMEKFPFGNIYIRKFSMNFVFDDIFFSFLIFCTSFSVHLMHADASSWKIFVCRLAKIAKSNSQLIIYTHRNAPQ